MTPEERITELRVALADAADVAVWLTGTSDLTDVPGWPQAREKLNRALKVSGEEGVRFTAEQLGES